MSIYNQLLKVKRELNPIRKTEDNPFFKSKFFDINALIEQVEPILLEHDLILTQPLKDGSVCTVLTYVTDDRNESIESAIELPKIADPQKLGSAITYYRRYTLQSLLGLQAIDDDGAAATQDILKMRQRAEDLLETSIWADDRKLFATAQKRIDNASAEELQNAIRELKENQKPTDRHSMTEINKLVKDKADAKD